MALGETERFSPGTGMRDDQVDLQYKTDGNVWRDWPGMNCVYHGGGLTFEWSWNYDDGGEVEGNEYLIRKNNNACV